MCNFLMKPQKIKGKKDIEQLNKICKKCKEWWEQNAKRNLSKNKRT
jgi:hypothetical protein